MYFSELYKLKRNSILVLTFSIIIVLGGISIIQGKSICFVFRMVTQKRVVRQGKN